LTAALSGTVGTPTGLVQFFEVLRHGKKRLLGTASLGDGTASLSVVLSPGRHSLMAVYQGDSTFVPATSAVVVVNVRRGHPKRGRKLGVQRLSDTFPHDVPDYFIRLRRVVQG
jgi:hypothetical protein